MNLGCFWGGRGVGGLGGSGARGLGEWLDGGNDEQKSSGQNKEKQGGKAINYVSFISFGAMISILRNDDNVKQSYREYQTQMRFELFGLWFYRRRC